MAKKQKEIIDMERVQDIIRKILKIVDAEQLSPVEVGFIFQQIQKAIKMQDEFMQSEAWRETMNIGKKPYVG